MSTKLITSLDNQRVKDAIKLRDRRQRTRQGRFAIDGIREIGRALDAGIPLSEAFVCEELCSTGEARQLADRLAESDARLWHVTPDVFEKLAYGERLDGVLAVAEKPSRTLEAMVLPPASLVAILVGLEKPGNVGAVLRSADAAGVAAVILADPRVELFNPNCIRASLGTVFTSRVAEASSAETIRWLAQRESRIYTARPQARQEYTAGDYRGETAIVLGSEASGVSPEWSVAGAREIRLPMHGAADSLNVSATAAVLFYEAQRQRQSDGPASN